jgi:hypothetical protein
LGPSKSPSKKIKTWTEIGAILAATDDMKINTRMGDKITEKSEN